MLRNTLVKILNHHFRKGQGAAPALGVEIGVCRAETSSHLLRSFPNLQMVLVDPWTGGEDFTGAHNRFSGMDAKDWRDLRVAAEQNLAPYRDRTLILAMTADQAADEVHARYTVQFAQPIFHPDFVFIDGDHRYEYVKRDIERWKPFIRPGGLLLGHDYGGRHPGVTRAVDEAFGDTIFVRRDRVWGVRIE